MRNAEWEGLENNFRTILAKYRDGEISMEKALKQIRTVIEE